MKNGELLLEELRSLLFWSVLGHIGIVFLPILIAGFFIYAFDTKSAGELGLLIACSSFVWSFPFMLYATVRIKHSEYVDNYISMGFFMGVAVMVLIFWGILLLRLWSALDGIAQPIIPSPMSGAVGLALIVVPVSLISSYMTKVQRKKAKVDWDRTRNNE